MIWVAFMTSKFEVEIWDRLQLVLIRFQQVGSDTSPQREFLPQLMTATNLDLNLVLKFGRDFEIPKDEVLSLWLKLVLIRPTAARSMCRGLLSCTRMNADGRCVAPDFGSSTYEIELDDSYRGLTRPVFYDLKSEILENVSISYAVDKLLYYFIFFAF